MESLPTPELIWDAHAVLGEGPVWVDRDSALYWVDIKQHLIHRLTWPAGQRKTWRVAEQIGTIHPMADGRFVGGLKDGVYAITLREEAEDAVVDLMCDPEPSYPGNRINDGKVGPDGAFWFGTMDDAEVRPTGSLHRLTTKGEHSIVDTGYVITNGPGFSPDGSVLYHTDTLGRTIYRFDLDKAGAASGKRRFIALSEASGYPDGMCVDAEGGIWQAHWDGARLTRFSADGVPVAVVPLPVANVTSCVFGGENLQTLFITTASKGLNAVQRAAQPHAGGLFAVDLSIVGLPTRYFEYGEG